jgi:protein SCO1/2
MKNFLGPAMSCHCCNPAAQTSTPAVGGYFLLNSHEGKRVDAFSFGDRLMLLFFGFTNCALVCPRELAKIDSALDQLGELAEKIQPLYVTVDPERDAPKTLLDYLKNRPRFIGLTGSRAEIEATKRSFRVFAERREDAQAPGGYVVPHTTISYLAAPGGQVLAHFVDSIDAGELAKRLLAKLQASH